MADEFLRLDHRLGLCARSPIARADEDNVVAQSVDVRDEAAVTAFAQRVAEDLGPIDLWINNAGVLDPIAFVGDLSPSALMDHLAINVGGVASGSKAFVQHLRARGGEGVLVNISSGAALKGYAGWGAYCAGKAAVDRLTECVQLEEAEHGLRAYAVAPGVIDTQMQTKIRGLTAEQFPMVEKFHDLKRRDAFNSPAFVAQQLLRIAFEPQSRPDTVVVRLPNEPRG